MQCFDNPLAKVVTCPGWTMVGGGAAYDWETTMATDEDERNDPARRPVTELEPRRLPQERSW
jgi:hypothetical protein